MRKVLAVIFIAAALVAPVGSSFGSAVGTGGGPLTRDQMIAQLERVDEAIGRLGCFSAAPVNPSECGRAFFARDYLLGTLFGYQSGQSPANPGHGHGHN